MHLPLSSWIIIAVVLFLVLTSGTWKWLRQRAHPAGTARPEAGITPPVFPLRAPEVQPAPAIQDRPVRPVAEIDEVGILDEIDIYLSYGHLEQAATTLRWYVDHHPADSAQAGHLLDLYLEMQDIDHLSELLEQMLENHGLSRDQAASLALAGLEKDPGNLAMRVFADAHLGLGNEAVDAELSRRNSQKTSAAMPTMVAASPGFAEAQRELQQVIVHPESADLPGIPMDAFRRNRPSVHSSQPDGMGTPALVQGQMPNTPISPAEQAIVSTLVSPYLAFRLLQESGQLEEAATLLVRQTILHPKELGLHVALLQMLHTQHEKERYGTALLSLYITLWGMGTPLRQRLLSLGRQLGDSPIWDELAGTEGHEKFLATMAERYGQYVPINAIPLSAPPLVEEQLRRDHMVANTEAGDQVLQEFNLLLDYGQVDEAVGLLEQAALTSPQQNHYFLPLMEMYERMQAQERFARFVRKILASDTHPDESVLRQMFHLSERLRPGGQQPV